MCSAAPNDPSDSASTHEAPPCSRPYGWRVALHRHPGDDALCGVARGTRCPCGRARSPLGAVRRVEVSVTGRHYDAGHGCRRCDTATGARPRLLLLDGHSLAYRAFFALPVENFSTTTGQPTNAVYGFTSMLINVLRDEAPTHVAVAFDVGRQTFRTEAYAGVQGDPQGDADRLPWPGALIREVLEALAVPPLQAEGFEADDVIATLAAAGRGAGMDVLIVTGDRDALQLVNDHVTVLMTRRGHQRHDPVHARGGQEKYGLTPAQYPDFAALRGDPSDNLPSIPGVGEKTAVEVDPAVRLARRAGRPGRRGAGQGRRRAARRTSPPSCATASSPSCAATCRSTSARTTCSSGSGTARRVHELFDTLQFRVLRERLYATLSVAEPEARPGLRVDGEVLGPGDVPSGSTSTRARGSPCTVVGRRHVGSRHRRRHRGRARGARRRRARTSIPSS